MKVKNLRLITLLILLLGAVGLSAQSKKEKKEQMKLVVKELLTSEKYKIYANTAFPMRGRSIPLSSPYALEVRNDSVISYLPYFGRAYSIPYGGGEGLVFKAPLKDYIMEPGKKGSSKIKFSARTAEDKYDFSISVFDNGAASIDVMMQNRQSISFSGEMDTKAAEK
ncbi:DUF4251 domain-containing protein [Bacteroides reticulotermitis]|uniref:DUF4251 domain-containing protein n=1 Tax=Bacteroides reticulotermitis TaxID=1133319 RepID=UPI003A871533